MPSLHIYDSNYWSKQSNELTWLVTLVTLTVFRMGLWAGFRTGFWGRLRDSMEDRTGPARNSLEFRTGTAQNSQWALAAGQRAQRTPDYCGTHLWWRTLGWSELGRSTHVWTGLYDDRSHPGWSINGSAPELGIQTMMVDIIHPHQKTPIEWVIIQLSSRLSTRNSSTYLSRGWSSCLRWYLR